MILDNGFNNNLSVEEMVNYLKQPGNRRSLAELDTVLDEIVDRNPEFVADILDIVNRYGHEQKDT